MNLRESATELGCSWLAMFISGYQDFIALKQSEKSLLMLSIKKY
jgi:hypothetical protein